MTSVVAVKIVSAGHADCSESAGSVELDSPAAHRLLLDKSAWQIVLLLVTTAWWSCSADGDEVPIAGTKLQWEQHGPLSMTKVVHNTSSQDDKRIERFRLLNSGTPESLQIRAIIEPSMLHNDFEAVVEIHSTAIGVRCGLLILFPHQMDPRTGKPLETILRGDVVRRTETWQTLRVQATQKAIQGQVRLIRAALNRSEIQMQDPMILGLVLLAEASPGETCFDIGTARFGPTIAPSPELLQIAERTTGSQEQPMQERRFVPMDVELDSMLLNQKPVILRLAPDHSEHLETLQQLGLNSVWVPDYRATDRARELCDAGLAVLATPPHPDFEPGDYSRLIHSLPPLDHQCPNVSAWYEGTRVSPEELPHLLAWSREVRSADRTFQRLQMADVTGAEGAASREIDLVGIGRHVVGRDESFGALRNLLVRKQKNAGQLLFPWTWIQTEPSSGQQLWRSNTGGIQPYVEPEQIQHQVYAALSAGYKGVGFWKTRALEIDVPADRETAIAIELACMEIELLEPFLARGRLEGHLALQSGGSPGSAGKPNPFLKSALQGRSVGAAVAGAEAPTGHDAAVISNNGTILILATAWDDVSQFVPGPMFEREVSLVVAASETASARQISIGGIQILPSERTAGGLPLKIRNFDCCAALIVTSDPALIRSLEQKIHGMAERSAARVTELASLKYLRVLATIEALREEHTVPPGVDSLMSSAKQMQNRAEFELNNRDFSEASLYARDAMRNLRQAQQACWKDAIAELSSPAASPHTISFSTLPDHWRLMHYLDQQSHRLTKNLLPSGDFESQKSLSLEGWTRDVPETSLYSATADIIQDARSGKLLRLVAWQTDPTATRVVRADTTPLLVTTPAIPVSARDVVVVSGRIRKGRTISAESKRPLIIFDSELGSENGIRTELDSEWTTFEMVRPIAEDAEFTVSLGLTGQAEVHIDNLQIRKLPSLATSGPVRLTGNEAVSETIPPGR